MKLTELRWLFGAAVATIFILGFVGAPANFGISAGWINGDYRFAGGTSPAALILAGLVVGLYVLLMNAIPAPPGKALPGLLRRWIAFWLDFALAMSALLPTLGILPALTEWRRTGTFQWSFERTTPARGDTLIAAMGVSLCFAGLALFYALPLTRRKPSPGTCIAGYQILSDDGTSLTLRRALLRTLLGFVAVASAYLAPFIARDRAKGKFWLDKVFDTRAARL